MANERALGMFQGLSHLFPLLFAPKPVVGSVPSAMPSVPAVRVISPVMIVMRMMVIRMMMIMMRVAVVAVCVVRMVVHFNRSDGRDRNRGNLLQFLHSSFGRWIIPVYSKPTKRDACPSKMGIRSGSGAVRCRRRAASAAWTAPNPSAMHANSFVVCADLQHYRNDRCFSTFSLDLFRQALISVLIPKIIG